jgi:Mrp family chromosome partitioning ATPase
MLHQLFDVDEAPGLADILAAVRRDGDKAKAEKIVAAMARASHGSGLTVLASGRRPPNPGDLLASDAVDRVVDEIGRTEYRYVVIDGPPLLGPVDGQALAQRVENVLVVSRLDRVTPENVLDVRELLDRLSVNVLGLVVIGAEAPAYYSSRLHPPRIETARRALDAGRQHAPFPPK